MVSGLRLAILLVPAACASQRSAVNADPSPALAIQPAAEQRQGAQKKEAPAPVAAGEKKYVDPEMGFSIERPDGWGFAPNVQAPDGGAIPLVIAQPDKGAQVIVQVAPRVASAEEISGDLRDKLDEHPGIDAGQAGPVKNGHEVGYGFGFTSEGQRAGRVAVIEGGDRLFVIIGSWPADAEKSLVGEVDEIFGSIRKAGMPKSGM